jgi:CSLREA domain-containing protein
MNQIARRTGLPALACLAALGLTGLPAAAANIPVTTLDDADAVDGECSLREAIEAANANTSYNECAAGTGPSDRILLTVPGTILLSSGLPPLSESAAILGLGSGASTIDGQDAWTLLRLDTGGSGQTFRLERLTLTNGAGSGSGPALNTGAHTVRIRDAVFSSSTASLRGGALMALNTDLVLERVWLTANTVTGDTGGGAIFADGGTLRLLASTVDGNTTTHASAAGGGLFVSSGVSAEIRDSTVSGNSTLGMGGGFYFNGTAVTGDLEIQVTRSTITQNHANADAAGAFQIGGGLAIGGGVSTSANLHLVSSIVAGNSDASPSGAAPDLALFGITSATSLGFNVIGDNSTVESEFPAGLPNAAGDAVGTSAAPIDPQLEPLALPGGTMPVHVPMAVAPSIVIDKGSCPGVVRDQRGLGLAATGERIFDAPGVLNNPAGDACDVGAVEIGPLVALAEPEILRDGFESATLLFWDLDAP